MVHYDRYGRVAPEDFLITLRGFDAILLGALGWPARLPDSVTLAPLIQMRQAFDLYANVRPARTFRGVLGPLRNEEPIDLVVVRENSEGEYVDMVERWRPTRPTRQRSSRPSTPVEASNAPCDLRSIWRVREAGGWP